MKIETRAFGSVEIDDNQIITFIDPMPGFPKQRRFAVLDPDPEHPFQWLQSVDRPEVCFLIVDPALFFPEYGVTLRPSDMVDLSISDARQAAVAVVVTVPEDPGNATANLLAPLVFNGERKVARQLILEGSGYPVRARLFDEVRQASNGG